MADFVSHDELRLSFTADEDGEGYLFATVRARGFAGLGSAWVRASELLSLARELQQTYPLSADRPIVLKGGVERGPADAVRRVRVEHVHVALAFHPVGSLGDVGCQVSLATPVYQESRPESQSRVVVELLTHYEQLAAFARAIEAMVEGRADEAVLGDGSD